MPPAGRRAGPSDQGRRLPLDTGVDIASFPAARVAAIVIEMIEHEPAYLLANPSSLALLVDHARRLHLRLPGRDSC